MEQYSELVEKIIANGIKEIGRNGSTYSLFGEMMRFSLENLPMITTKKISFKNIIEELLWFIRGDTNNQLLKNKGVNIWNTNSSRKFLDSVGLKNEENDLGPIYGHQWRHFNAPYSSCYEDYSGKGVDQLQNIIDALKNPEKRYSRRLVMSAWNPQQIDEMALPPCHVMTQFNVHGNVLSCVLYQRSADVGLGMPYNITSYSILTCLLAHHCDLIPGEFIYMVGNTHIYENHIEGLKEQIIREPFPLPTLKILNKYENINEYTSSDFELNSYKCHPPIKLEMIA
jgi:thymidylate synthase